MPVTSPLAGFFFSFGHSMVFVGAATEVIPRSSSDLSLSAVRRPKDGPDDSAHDGITSPHPLLLLIWLDLGCASSQVSESFMYVSGEDAAKQEGLVQRVGVTHIINCAGPQCPNYLEHVRPDRGACTQRLRCMRWWTDVQYCNWPMSSWISKFVLGGIGLSLDVVANAMSAVERCCPPTVR